jgi:hypothetical protein
MMLKEGWYFKHHPKKGKNQGFNGVFIASTEFLKPMVLVPT